MASDNSATLTPIQYQIVDYINNRSAKDLTEDAICLYLLFNLGGHLFDLIYGYGLIRVVTDWYKDTAKSINRWFLSLPPLKKKVNEEMDQVHDTLNSQFLIKPSGTDYREIPQSGLAERTIKTKLSALQKMKAANWEDGRVSGAVYYGNEHIAKLQSDTYHQFCFANQLHPDTFPGVRLMEAEVVSMVLNLFHPPATACGTTTSGGTESLLLACLAAREKARIERGVQEPEIVAPKSIHAAVFKASQYFGIKLRLVDLTDDYVADMDQYARLINRNTCLLMGSAPNFPYGTVDNIEKISELALKHKLPLHVDCCLGSFIIAYYERTFSKQFQPFDFSLPGVTSISCDTHKYGFAPKGSSVIMYRDPSYRRYQYFVMNDWLGGLYGSPTLAGSRPGALTAGTWATLMHIGHNGYEESCNDIVTASLKLKDAIENDIPELQVMGDPQLCVVAFKSDVIDVHALIDEVTTKGWHLSPLQNPSAAHLCVTRLTVPVMDDFIIDLKASVKQLVANPPESQSTTTQIYGVASSLATNSVADKITEAFLDVLYQN